MKLPVKPLVEWRRCPFCNGDVVRVRDNCGYTKFECRGECRAVVSYKTSDTALATEKYNRRVKG